MNSTPETDGGRQKLHETIDEYYRGLERNGKGVHRIIKGNTPDGTLLEVSEFSDVAKPPRVRPEEQSEDDYHKQWDAWHEGHQYSVFVFSPSENSADNLMQAISPRRIGDVIVMRGSGIDIDVENPARPITATKADVELALKEGSRERDPNGFQKLYEAWRQSVDDADKLHLPQVPSDVATFNGQQIEPS